MPNNKGKSLIENRALFFSSIRCFEDWLRLTLWGKNCFLLFFASAAACILSPLQALAICNVGCGVNGDVFLGESALGLDTGSDNTALGGYSMFGESNGTYNTAIGFEALFNNIGSDGSTAIGAFALFNSQSNATAVGYAALESNTTGDFNTAVGYQALLLNTTGSYNTAVGDGALYFSTEGNFNTAVGDAALNGNTGSENTAIGAGALLSNQGSHNIAVGVNTLYLNTSGTDNTVTGTYASYSNTSGNQNTAYGYGALNGNVTGSNNTAMGYNAFDFGNGSNNTAIGHNALAGSATGSSNIAVGESAGFNLTTGSNNIDIGNVGSAGESRHIRIGTSGIHAKAFIAGISGATVPGGVGVIVGANGQLGTVVSSERFKDNIEPMDKASEAILSLKPVTFCYKHELDPAGIPQFGLLAEEVDKVNPDLVARDDEGKPYSVRYEAVNTMLLNEFLKEHQEVQVLKTAVAREQSINTQQQKEIQVLTATLKEQASRIDKVSATIEMTRPASKVAINEGEGGFR